MNQTSPPSRTGSLRALPTLLLALITLAVYWPSLHGEFVYDDLILVQGNPLIQSFGNLGEAFSRPYWEGLDPDGPGVVGLWRPLTTVALMVGNALGGGSPLGFHWASLLAHVAVALLAARLAQRLSENTAVGFATGLLFALHPVHVESVAWISGICDPLAGGFCLLALSSHWKWTRGSRDGLPWLTGLWFLLGLLSKESALAALPMMVVLDLFRFGPKAGEARGSLVRGYLPIIAALLLYVAARMAVFGDLAGGFFTVTTHFDVPASRLTSLRLELFGGFLGLLFWPAEMNLFRAFQPEFAAGDSTLLVAGLWSVLCLGAAIFLIVKKSRPGAIAWLLIPASLLPMLVRLSALGIFPLADRYLYLAVFGFTFSLALLAWKKLPAPIASGLIACVAIAYGWISVDRIADWSSEEALFTRAAEQSPNSPYVAWGRGRVFLTKYKRTKVIRDLEQAHMEYERGMELLAAAANGDATIFATKRDHLEMNLGLAWCFLFEGELDVFHDFKTPTQIFDSAVRTYPQSSNAHIGLGVALMMSAEQAKDEARGEYYLRAGEMLRKALQLSETDEARNAMGQLLLRLGDSKKAVSEFERALELRPGHLAYMLYLVQALEFEGEDARIRELLERAHENYPNAAEPMRMLGSLAVQQQRQADALQWFERALAQDPNDGYAHLQRGMLLAQLDQPKEALSAILRACELAPNEFEPQYNAAIMLLKSETPKKAHDFLMRAYILRPEGTGDGPGSIGDRLSIEIRKLSPDDPLILWQLAEADRRLGLTDSAMDWVERALKLDDQDGRYFYTRAMLRAADEEMRDDVIADLERATELLPNNFDIINELGHQLAETDRKQEAVEQLLKALQLIAMTGLPRDEQAQIHRTLSHKLATVQAEIDATGN